jgi:hypothetical protein
VSTSQTGGASGGARSGGVGTAIAVRVDAGIGGVGSARVVVAVSASGLLIVLVRGDSVLDLVDEVGHDDGVVGLVDEKVR